jgi:protein SCO1/2
LCPLTAHQLLANVEKLRLAAGRDFTLTFIGILPTEDVNDATAARQAWGAPPSARFLRVADANAAARLRAALDIGVAGTSGDPSFRHEAVVAILSPTGGLSRRFVGYSYSADDLEQSLVEAASGRVATLGDRILLFCTHLDPRTGRHTGVVLLAFRVAAVLGLGALATIVWRLSRR